MSTHLFDIYIYMYASIVLTYIDVHVYIIYIIFEYILALALVLCTNTNLWVCNNGTQDNEPWAHRKMMPVHLSPLCVPPMCISHTSISYHLKVFVRRTWWTYFQVVPGTTQKDSASLGKEVEYACQLFFKHFSHWLWLNTSNPSQQRPIQPYGHTNQSPFCAVASILFNVLVLLVFTAYCSQTLMTNLDSSPICYPSLVVLNPKEYHRL